MAQVYISVTRTVAEGLHKIQGQTTAYTGSLLPVLLVIKTNLPKKKANNYSHADPFHNLLPAEPTSTRRKAHASVAKELDSWSSSGTSKGVLKESLLPAR